MQQRTKTNKRKIIITTFSWKSGVWLSDKQKRKEAQCRSEAATRGEIWFSFCKCSEVISEETESGAADKIKRKGKRKKWKEKPIR